MPQSADDTFSIIESVIRQGDALAAVTRLDEMMRDLYWKQKNLFSAVAIGRAAAQHALISAVQIESTQPEVAIQLRKKGFAICYNLASFTWSGWGEEGISITPSDEMIGLDAARANLRLSGELKLGDLQFCRAHWIVGAHQLAARDFAAATESFTNSERHARAADQRGEEWLAIAFARLAHYLAENSDALHQQLTDAIAELAQVKDGEFFASQVTKAMEIFTTR